MQVTQNCIKAFGLCAWSIGAKLCISKKNRKNYNLILINKKTGLPFNKFLNNFKAYTTY